MNKKTTGLFLIPLTIIIIAILIPLNIKTVFEPPFLLPVMNTIFLGLIPLGIAYISARVFMKNGSSSILLMGTGFLIFGLGSIIAGWLNPLPGGPNMTVTMHNTCACFGSLLILAGAVTGRRVLTLKKVSGINRTIIAIYSVIVIIVFLFSLATMKGFVSPFFIPGVGPTIIRQIILENAVLFFVISSALLMLTYLKEKSDFFFWYSVSLALISVGLLAIFFQPSVGSLIGWVGRTAQYLGCIFTLYAVFIVQQAATKKGLPLEVVLGNFFVEAERSYRQLVETANDAIIAFDREYRVLLWNTAAERIFGYTRDEAIGASFPELVTKDGNIQAIKNIDADSCADDNNAHVPASVEITCKRKNGTFFPVELTISQRNYGEMLIYTSILRNLTERKQVEEALYQSNKKLTILLHKLQANENSLRESEARFRSLFDQMEEGSVLHELVYDDSGSVTDYRILAVNAAYEKLLGIQREDALGKLSCDVYHTTKPPYLDIFSRVEISGKAESFETFYQGILKHFVVSVYSPKKRQVATVFTDITEQKRAEGGLRQANEKLNLLSGITRHDINNQLMVLLGYLEILEKKQPDPTLNPYTQKIGTAAERISNMIQFTKEYEEIGVKAPVWHEIHNLVEKAVKEATLGQVGVKNYLPEEVLVFSDPMIVKVFYNLLDNAVRYGGKITTVEFSLQKQGEGQVIICKDNGEGIPVPEKEKIFERGFGKNSGLGLFLAREVLSITGITIIETGEPGKGARFEITVPSGMWRLIGELK